MAKGKMPPQLLEYFKNKNKKKEDGEKMTDKEKRKEASGALAAARSAQEACENRARKAARRGGLRKRVD